MERDVNPGMPDVLIRFNGKRGLPGVHEMTGYSRGWVWQLEAAGIFPKRVQIGPNSVGWWMSEVLAYMRSRPRITIGKKNPEQTEQRQAT